MCQGSHPPCTRLLQPDVSTCQIIYRKDSGCCMLELVLVLVARPVWSGTAAPTGPGLATLATAAVGCCWVMLGGVALNMCAAGHRYTAVVLLLLMACSELRLID